MAMPNTEETHRDQAPDRRDGVDISVVYGGQGDGRSVALAWFSPDCKHFSRAKGGKPVDKNIRGLAWVAIKWVYQVSPCCIMMENVPEKQI